MQPDSFESEPDPSFENGSFDGSDTGSGAGAGHGGGDGAGIDESPKFDSDASMPADQPFTKKEFLDQMKREKDSESRVRKVTAPTAEHAHSDKPSRIDSLHRQHYVKALAALITHPKTEIPLTLGIYGPWGSGKSSFMLQLREMIAPKIPSVEFNPWRYNDPSALWYGLISQIAMALDQQFTLWDRLRLLLFHKPSGHVDILKKMRTRAMAGAKKIHNWVTGTVAFLGLTQPDTLAIPLHKMAKYPVVADTLQAMGLVDGPVTPEAVLIGLTALMLLGWSIFKLGRGWLNPFLTQVEANRLSSGEGQAEFRQLTFDELDLIRDLLKGAMQDKKGKPIRVAIFLDDLDRCSPDRVVEVLEAVHLCLEGLPFVTVLGMDSRVVSHAIASRYEFMLDDEATSIEKEAYGQYFLQKIVHIPFQLPPPWVYGKYIKRLMGVSPSASQDDPAGDDEPKLIHLEQQDLQEKMAIAEQEMQSLNPLVMDLKASPRSVKCLINQYRLAKAINSQLEGDRQLEPEKLFYWLVLFQNWPKWGSVLFGEVEKDRTFLDLIDPRSDRLKDYPLSLVQFVNANRGLLAEVVGHPGGLEFARCFSFLAPEGPFNTPQAPGPGK